MRFDIYCTVIDNYGDIGVCWRLARQLVAEYGSEYGCEVHLWVNDDGWQAARQLIGELPQVPAPTHAEGVTVSAWSLAHDAEDCTGDVLIEGFGCTLPGAALAQLAARTHKPVWINLEYFSAEDWVPNFHLQSGFDWERGATRWFFFPGVHAHSGGILRERELIAQRDPAQTQTPNSNQFWVLCFAYAHAPYAEWLDALAIKQDTPIVIDLCGQQTQLAVAQLNPAAYPNVTVRNVPFVSQPKFDALLRQADVLWVRGEDSLARALWSGRPFVWHIYPQAENAHHAKLLAWLAHYAQPFPALLREALVDVYLAWNGVTNAALLGEAWRRLMRQWDDWQQYSWLRRNQFAQAPDLAQRLMAFVKAQSF